MHLADYLAEDLVFVIDKPRNKQAVLETLVVHVKKYVPGIHVGTLLTKLEEREAEVSTGIGNGVAIPHTTLPGLEKSLCVIAKISQAVDFNSIDDVPVNIAFLLLSPPDSAGVHLRLLARIARLVMNADFVSRIAGETDAKKIYAATVEEDGLHV